MQEYNNIQSNKTSFILLARIKSGKPDLPYTVHITKSFKKPVEIGTLLKVIREKV